MIINNQSDPALLSAISILRDDSGKVRPIKKVTEFDTNTKLATKSDSSTETAYGFTFVVSSTEDIDSMKDLLPEELHEHISLSPVNFRQSMVFEAGDPDHTLQLISPVKGILIQCSNCSTYYLAFIDNDGDVWSAAKANASDKHHKLTKLDKDNLVCDNCTESLSPEF